MPPDLRRERAALSVTDRCLRRGGDGTSMLSRVPELVVNIAHFPKHNKLSRGQRNGPSADDT
jgi:hypothetical protein